MLFRQLAHYRQRQIANQRGLHEVGAIVLLEKSNRGGMQTALGLVRQRSEVTDLKAVRWVIAQELSRQSIGNAKVLLTPHRPLRIHRVLFLVDISWVQKRVGEETGESIQRFRKGVVLHHHHVIGDIQTGVRIGHTAVL